MITTTEKIITVITNKCYAVHFNANGTNAKKNVCAEAYGGEAKKIIIFLSSALYYLQLVMMRSNWKFFPSFNSIKIKPHKIDQLSIEHESNLLQSQS